jgi:putative FmdB family regulatory protein
MPVYEYFCETCNKEVTRTMTISEHERGGVTCPGCGGSALRPLVGTIFTQTSRKS